MPDLFPPGATRSPDTHPPETDDTRSWAWTVVAIHALRHALCPALTLGQLSAATTSGALNTRERRKRVPQRLRLREILRAWVLG